MQMIVRAFAKDDGGATAVEYGLIVAVLSLAMVAGFAQFSNELENMLGHPESTLQESLRPK
jgi:pilus assembly protein Flp/PilA